MSSLFETYLQLGFTHIADITAYDHILFIVALCAIYQLRDWKKVAILITAFTIGHSITLALAVFEVITFSKTLIEILIPVTIILTCIFNIVQVRQLTTTDLVHSQSKGAMSINYLLALGFGFIHGMGFSNFLRSSLKMPKMPKFPGSTAAPEATEQADTILWELLSFNLGLELGQLLIVGFILFISFLAFTVVKVNQRAWVIGLSTIVGIFALQLLFKQL